MWHSNVYRNMREEEMYINLSDFFFFKELAEIKIHLQPHYPIFNTLIITTIIIAT